MSERNILCTNADVIFADTWEFLNLTLSTLAPAAPAVTKVTKVPDPSDAVFAAAILAGLVFP